MTPLIITIIAVILIIIIIICSLDHNIDEFEKTVYEFNDLRYLLPDHVSNHNKHHFDIDKIINCQRAASNVISISLFVKHDCDEPGYLIVNNVKVPITEENLRRKKPQDKFHKNRTHNKSVWNMYIQPTIENSEFIAKYLPDWKMRLYLANDLQFLVPYFNLTATELYIMKSTSQHGVNPGSMWRCLVMDDPNVNYFNIYDSDFLIKNRQFLNFNAPYLRPDTCLIAKRGAYKTNCIILAGLIGGFAHRIQKLGINIQELMERTIEANISKELSERTHNTWHEYSYDEVFLNNILMYELSHKVCIVLMNKYYNKQEVYDYFHNYPVYIVFDQLKPPT